MWISGFKSWRDMNRICTFLLQNEMWKINIPQEDCDSLFNTNTSSEICVLLCYMPVVLYSVHELEVCVEWHPEVPQKSVRVCLEFLHLHMKFPFARQTMHNVHWVHPPQSLWYILFLLCKKTLKNDAKHHEKSFPLLADSPYILQPPSWSPDKHFQSILTDFDRFSFAMRMCKNGACLQLCMWCCVAHRLVLTMWIQLLLEQGQPRRAPLRLPRRVQCGWGLNEPGTFLGNKCANYT